MRAPLDPARKASYALVVLGLFAVARWDLGACLLAGLFAYLLLDLTERLLREAGVRPLAARACAVVLFLVVAVLLSLILISFTRLGLSRLPLLLDRLLPRLDGTADRFGLSLPIDSAADLRAYVLDAARENVRSITATSGVLTHGFFRILLAVAAALAKFLASRAADPPAAHFHSALSRECAARGARLWASFELVAGAQVLAAALNAAATAAFLFAAAVPFRTVLTLATFVCGMVPAAGAFASGALVAAAALTRSPQLALAAAVFLLLWHKLRHVVAGRIAGGRADLPLWAVLMSLLAGDALMGVPGLILAPTLLHYAREELRALPEPAP
ncbi:MAG: AI-2E family transporter [Elusimicrobia bacterium]|nr:AI-2E family transporter [Elusimicrobiota bacterium]